MTGRGLPAPGLLLRDLARHYPWFAMRLSLYAVLKWEEAVSSFRTGPATLVWNKYMNYCCYITVCSLTRGDSFFVHPSGFGNLLLGKVQDSGVYVHF